MLISHLKNILVTGALLAVGAVLMVSYVRSEQRRAVHGQHLVQVLVAKGDIPAGTTARDILARKLAEVREVRSADAVPQAISTLDHVAGMSLTTAVHTGDQLSSTRFGAGDALAPSSRFAGTYRWVALPFGRFQYVDGAVRTGDHVDLYASHTGGVGNQTKTVLAARNVLVVKVPSGAAANRGLGAANTDPDRVYVLQVPDPLAQRLVWANAYAGDAGLQMVLRPATGDAQEQLPAVVTGISTRGNKA